MKILRTFTLGAALLAAACSPAADPIPTEIEAGRYTRAEELLTQCIEAARTPAEAASYVRLRDSLQLVRKDFRRTRDEVMAYIRRYIPSVSEEQIASWEASGVLEYRTIDGEKRYFVNAAPNVFRVDSAAIAIKRSASDASGDRTMDSVLNAQLPRIMAAGSGVLAEATPMKVHHEIRLSTDKVAVGDTVRVWIPFPRTDVARQQGVELLAASDPWQDDAQAPHNAIFMERVIATPQDAERPFSIDYRYTSYGQWFDMEHADVQPYDKGSELYGTYTAERPPHIVFSDRIARLTRRLVGNEENPYRRVRAIFDYITAGYPWASAINYSTIPCIPEYVLDNHKGDCGQVGLLFITMARCAGVPARWQSGLMFHPGSLNLHDWAEVYYEGIGWVPVDVSFGRNEALTFPGGAGFFASGIDSYRMIANSDYGRSLVPEKHFMRNDTVDSQSGEVETQRGMLISGIDYHYDFEVEYL